MPSKNYSTPGVYIEEKDAFSRSVVPVATAVPCFVGYTEKAVRNNESLSKKLVKIKSIGDYILFFGGPPKTTYTVTVKEDNSITISPASKLFYLYKSLQAYFANGGGDCYIFSLNDYNNATPSKEDFLKVIEPLENEPEPTLIVMPDAHLIEDSKAYYNVWKEVLIHCKKMINRFAILDIHNGGKLENVYNPDKADELLKTFKDNIGTDELAYGAVYWPWIQASVVSPRDIDFNNITNWESTIKRQVKDHLTKEIKRISAEEFDDHFSSSASTLSNVQQHEALMQLSPLYKAIMNKVRDTANIMPASAAMAGIYKYVDNDRGTFQSPANISVTSVAKPLLTINDEEQESLNIPIDGKAINVIRSFPGKGTLVWGARTMDGNSQDWRYISVRRTVSMLELSIKYAAEAYVFEPNNASTWSNIQSMISNFLTNMWQGGALAGTTAGEAFSVSVGLGSTMTSVDILDGYMKIMVKVAITRPAEFIVITFQQQMQTT